MPYGGERSLEDLAKMEKCVKDVMAQGKSKSSAIAICKVSIGISKGGKRRGSKA